MKKVSRIIALLLIVLMLASLAVSCKKAPSDDEGAAIEGEDGSSTEGNGDGDDGASTDGTTGNTGSTSNGKTPSGGTSTSGKNPSGGGTNGNAGGNTSSTGGGEQVEGTGTVVDEDRNVTHTDSDKQVNEDGVFQEAITNTVDFVPDELQGLEKSERRATEASKYNFDQNPLINRDRQQNKKAMPSFDINDTGFVRAGTKVSDLKGKTLTFCTSDNFAAWSYRNEKGETIDEWTWFKQLKSEIGLNIKYTVKQHMSNLEWVMQNMNAGKPCDLIYTNHYVWPSVLCLSRSITDKTNINNLGSSPGICKNTMDTCKWGNTLRLIAPIGLVDVLWYNQTLNQEMGYSDPHYLWENGKWNWDSFKKYMLNMDKTNKNGEKLLAWCSFRGNNRFTWPITNGVESVAIDPDASVPTVIDSWEDARVLEAWEFYCDVAKQVQAGWDEKSHIGLYQGTTMMSATMYTQVYRDTEYSKKIRIMWVPYPKSTNESGRDGCWYYGFGMLLPKKTSNEKNVDYALKFMELWATRFTETLFDNLFTFEYYKYDYLRRKQYFDFVTKNVTFDQNVCNFDGMDPWIDDFTKALQGNAAYNVRTEALKCANRVHAYIKNSVKFGQ